LFDRYFLPLQQHLFDPPARWLAARKVSADSVTVLGFAIGLLAMPLLASGHYTAALLAIALNRLCDGLDGALARCTQPTDRGAFLDIALDFVFYACVPLGFALADPSHNALAAAVLLFAFMGTATSFLAFSAIAARRGMTASNYPAKGLYYLGGLTEGFETIALFVALCLWPSAFPVMAYIFAAMCGLTTVTRWWWGWRRF